MKIKGILSLSKMELILFLREPSSLFWVIGFPLFCLIFFSYAFPQPVQYPKGGVFSPATFFLPGMVGLILFSASLLSMTINVATYRELGILRRLRLTPLNSIHFIAAEVLSRILIISCSLAVLFIVGIFFFDVTIKGSFIFVLAAILLCMVALLSFGFLLGSVAPSARSANNIGILLLMPMLFFSEMFLASSHLPWFIRPISTYLPLTPLNIILRDIFMAGGNLVGNIDQVAILAGWAIIGFVLSARFFKWE
ncbi:MAG: ABC transporter permease [Theionarchaea archaeon]|nr:ABC transporter permease [Theionarchaea archaeon]MBU7000086.1 ABC transporter permease [Theionarchaea archaeon]MBU7022462.1 ABC transporter permease [Theionarchaea archaeon]